MRHRRHDVAVMHVLDPAEVEFPFDEPTLFHGLEDSIETPADPAAIRSAYRSEFDDYLRRLRSICRDAEIDYVPMRTDRSLEATLAEYLAGRG